jgi:mannose-1-phosphate guanylyltransferase
MKKQNHVYAVILAGGSGTRFWPLSRESRPKQFLHLTGRGSLLQQTVKRIRSSIPAKQILIVTNQKHQFEVMNQLRGMGILLKNILLEPTGKNTAPAVCWAAQKIHQSDPKAVLAVFPSDHVILNNKKFLLYLNQAIVLAQKEYLVTFGIVPTRPATGFGYLKAKRVKKGGHAFLQVERFCEKPNLLKAQQFLKSGNYYWNSGMFVWKTETLLNEFKQYLPKLEMALRQKTDNRSIKKIWGNLQSVSIDYGILEKSKRVAAVFAPNLGWSDLGSWDSLSEVFPSDTGGNVFCGDHIGLNCANTVVWGHKRVIATIGVKDLIVVDTDDAVLVCHKNQAQKIREVVSLLKERKRKEV